MCRLHWLSDSTGHIMLRLDIAALSTQCRETWISSRDAWRLKMCAITSIRGLYAITVGSTQRDRGRFACKLYNTRICYYDNIYLSASTPLLGLHDNATTFDSPRCIQIINDSEILIPLGALGGHWHAITTSHSLVCIRITLGNIKTKTSSSFNERFFVIEGQIHRDPD